MPTARIAVVAISDEGDQVIVWGIPEHDPVGEPVGYVFSTKTGPANEGLAERASRLATGVQITVEYTPVMDGWAAARGLTTP